MTPSNSNPEHSPKTILIVTGDCPSHPYACLKLATVLAEHHYVTVAGPNGSALSRLQAETKRHNESTSKNRIECVSIGDVTTVVHCNVRTAIDPRIYSPLKIIFNSLNPNYNPYVSAGLYEQVMDDQVPTYENVKRMLPDYDLVYPIHSAAATVFDASEALQQEQAASVPPIIQFSSTPYDSGFFRKAPGSPSTLWRTPRPVVALPHVALYSKPSKAFEKSRSFVLGLAYYFVQLFWMWLDTRLSERAWRLAGKRNDARRATRGLPPVYDGNRWYWYNYPLLSMGGVKPYVTDGDYVADNATVIGSLLSSDTSHLGQLSEWFARVGAEKLVYASFGTGTQLSSGEANNIAELALSLADTGHHLLLSLTRDQQERLRSVFDEVIGSKPSKDGEGFYEYMGGLFRIESDVPQENLLMSGKVDLFVCHMGFGGFSEGVNGGVPFVAYGTGCDQFYNTERAVEAGIAVRANNGLKDLDFTVQSALADDTLMARSRQLALDSAAADTNHTILKMAEEVCDKVGTKRRGSTASTCSTSTA